MNFNVGDKVFIWDIQKTGIVKDVLTYRRLGIIVISVDGSDVFSSSALITLVEDNKENIEEMIDEV